MKIYLAAGDHFMKYLRRFPDARLLYSYFYFPDPLALLSEPCKDFFIDSGGFTARNANVNISVDEYSTFLSALRDQYAIAANLDTNDFDESQRNLALLRAKGHRVAQVYHVSEFMSKDKREIIQDYFRDETYFAIGGTRPQKLVHAKVAKEYYRYVFKHYREGVKIHGFGVTREDILLRYPFYSVDSSTYSNAARYGIVMKHKGVVQKLRETHPSSLLKKKSLASKLDVDQLVALGQGMKVTQETATMNNIAGFIELEKRVTKIWERRGVRW